MGAENFEKISINFSESHSTPLLLGEENHEVVGEVYTPMDSSPSVQNDNEDAQESKIVVPLYEREYGEAEEIFDEEERIISPQLVEHVSLRLEWQTWSQVDSSPSAQNDENIEKNNMQMDSLANSQNDNSQQEDLDEEWKPELVISEVYYDGSDEWIEIYNIWNGDFSWDIELSWTLFRGSKTNQIYKNVQIYENDFLIIANSDEMFDFSQSLGWYANIILNTWGYSKFSITDTKEIQISLTYSWDGFDTFFAHEYRVKYRDGEKISFHKVITPIWLIVTRAYFSEEEDRQNVRPWLGVIATPWLLIETTEKVKDYSKDPNSDPEDFTPADCWDVEEDIITISEIFWWWNRYEPYIELSIHEDIEYEYDYLLLTWSLLTQDLIINLDEETETYDRENLQKNTRLILTTKAWDLTEAGLITIILQPDLKFNNFSWELELYGITRQTR